MCSEQTNQDNIGKNKGKRRWCARNDNFVHLQRISVRRSCVRHRTPFYSIWTPAPNSKSMKRKWSINFGWVLTRMVEFGSSSWQWFVIYVLQALATTPRYLLTPFLICALLTMCNINRYLDSTRLASSAALPFLRTVIRNNERERELCKNSAWCRHTSEQNVVEMQKILTILIEQRFACDSIRDSTLDFRENKFFILDLQ